MAVDVVVLSLGMHVMMDESVICIFSKTTNNKNNAVELLNYELHCRKPSYSEYTVQL